MSKVEPTADTDEAELERLDDEVFASPVRERANQPTIPVSVEDLSGPGNASDGSGLTAEEKRGEYCVVSDSKGCHSERSEES